MYWFFVDFQTDHGDDHHEDSSQKKQEHTFNSDAEKMIKNVKHAMANSEGCRVCYPYVHYNFIRSTTILNAYVFLAAFFFQD